MLVCNHVLYPVHEFQTMIRYALGPWGWDPVQTMVWSLWTHELTVLKGQMGIIALPISQ